MKNDGGPSADAGGENSVDRAVPDALLMPLIEVAADTLRDLDAVDVPNPLRLLHSFDRRGLLVGPGPRQLRRALTSEAGFQAAVLERFGAMPEVEAVLGAWTADPTGATLVAAAARDDLALFASAFWAIKPPGHEFGLGIIVTLDAQRRDRQRQSESGKSAEQDRAAVEEGRRRADAARLEAEAATARVEQELQRERRARRAREDEALAAAAAAQRQADSLQTELDRTRAEIEEHKKRASIALQRARSLEDDLRRLRADTRALEARAESLGSHLDDRDARALDDAVAVARQLSVSLDALQRRVREATPADSPREPVARPRSPAPIRRATPQLPLGVVADTPAGIEAMLSTPGVVLVIDGYNVAHRAWPDAMPADQRERLGIAVTALCRRVRCEVVLVFDGDNSSGPRPVLRRGGVRVLFSDAGQEADELVVLEVEGLPRRVPVVVASSDAWVREHAAEQGATVVGADTLVRVLRPTS